MLYNAIITTLVYIICFSIFTYIIAFRIIWPSICFTVSNIVIPAFLCAYPFLCKVFSTAAAIAIALKYIAIAYGRQFLGIEKADTYLDIKIHQIKNSMKQPSN